MVVPSIRYVCLLLRRVVLTKEGHDPQNCIDCSEARTYEQVWTPPVVAGSHALRVQPLPSARATVTAARRAITFTWCILQATLVPPAILSFPTPFYSTFEEPVFQRGCCATSSYLVSSLFGDLLTMPISPLLHFNGMLRREL